MLICSLPYLFVGCSEHVTNFFLFSFKFLAYGVLHSDSLATVLRWYFFKYDQYFVSVKVSRILGRRLILYNFVLGNLLNHMVSLFFLLPCDSVCGMSYFLRCCCVGIVIERFALVSMFRKPFSCHPMCKFYNTWSCLYLKKIVGSFHWCYSVGEDKIFSRKLQ